MAVALCAIQQINQWKTNRIANVIIRLTSDVVRGAEAKNAELLKLEELEERWLYFCWWFDVSSVAAAWRGGA